MKKYLRYAIIAVLILNFILSISRSFFNYSKIFSDKNTYFFKNSQDVNIEYFGSGQIIFNYFSQKDIRNLFIANPDPLTFYYLRYKLYPVKIFRNNEPYFGNPNIPKFYDYLVINSKENLASFKEIVIEDYTKESEIKFKEEKYLIYKKDD